MLTHNSVTISMQMTASLISLTICNIFQMWCSTDHIREQGSLVLFIYLFFLVMSHVQTHCYFCARLNDAER